MQSATAKLLDWCAIQAARLSVPDGAPSPETRVAAEKLACHPDFSCDSVSAPTDWQFGADREFRFTSAVKTRWIENNTVHGRFYPCGENWIEKPTVLLLPGWNAEWGYRLLASRLGRRLGRSGVNAAMIELPYHGRRKPRRSGVAVNFLSGDLFQTLEAARQALADVQAALAWFKTQGCPSVGLWGFSLGGWLSGLLACSTRQVNFAVLLTPIVEIEHAVEHLAFCKPIRVSLRTTPIRLDGLNLTAHQPVTPPENILLIQSQFDLFVPPELIDKLGRLWNRAEIWRVRHGHLSVLLSAQTMERIIRWIALKSAP